MTSRLDWTALGDDHRFNALIRAIIAFSDPQADFAWLPTRAGSDLKIDARSGDGRVVWQFKYRNPSASPGDVISIAKVCHSELTRAKSDDKLGNAWAPVNRWILATTVHVNPQTQQRWDADIRPKFRAIGLEAVLWHPGHIETEVLKFPDIVAHFFGGKGLCFEPIADVRRRLVRDQAGARDDTSNFFVPFLAHQAELDQALEKVRGYKLVEVIGDGGVGKSRFLSELAQSAEDKGMFTRCVFGQVEAMTDTPDWPARIPSGQTLVIVDEPSRKLQDRIHEVARGMAADSGPTFVMAVRPAARLPPAVGYQQRWRADRVELARLPDATAREFAQAYLRALEPKTRWPASHAGQIAKLGAGLPVWMASAAWVVAKGGSLPENLRQLADQHFDAMLEPLGLDRSGRLHALAVARWLALTQPLRERDGQAAEFLSREAGLSSAELQETLDSLMKARVVRRRGRLIEVTPDTLADTLVCQWLVRHAGTGHADLSQEGNRLLPRLLGDSGAAPIDHAERILARLARVESLAEGSADLLGVVLERALLEARSAPDAHAQRNILRQVAPLAGWRPREVLNVLRQLRTGDVPDAEREILPGFAVTTHRRDLLLDLPRAVLEAACSCETMDDAQRAFTELLELVRIEAQLLGDDPSQARNDGKRAVSAVEMLVLPGRSHRLSFVRPAWHEAKPLLGQLGEEIPLTAEDVAALRSVVRPLLKIEFHDSWREEWQFHWHRQKVGDVEALQARARARELLWQAVSSVDAHPSHRPVSWDLLAEGHRQAAHLGTVACAQERGEDLDRCAALLEAGCTDASAWFSRDIWDWHLTYDDDVEMTERAKRCHRALQSYRELDEFIRLTSSDFDRANRDEERAWRLARLDNLASLPSEKIVALGDKWCAYAKHLDPKRFWQSALILVLELAWRTWQRPDMGQLAQERLTSAEPEAREPALFLAIGWIAAVAHQGNTQELLERLRDFVDWPCSTEAKADLVRRTYGHFGSLSRRALDARELLILTPILRQLCGADPVTALAIVGRFGVTCIGDARLLAGELLGHVEGAQVQVTYESLVKGLAHGCFHERARETDVPDDIRAWLVELLAEIPDLDFRDNHTEWWLKTAFQQSKIPLSRALDILCQRFELWRAAGDEGDATRVRTTAPRVRPLPIGFNLEELVDAGDVDTDELGRSQRSLDRFLNVVLDCPSASYGLAELLTKLDPHAALVAPAIERLLGKLDPSADFERFVQAIGLIAEYGDTSGSWRQVASSAFRHLGPAADADHRLRLSSALVRTRTGVWHGTHDELNPRWQAAVDHCQRLLDEEDDPNLFEYRRARLKQAQADYQYWQDNLAEERWS